MERFTPCDQGCRVVADSIAENSRPISTRALAIAAATGVNGASARVKSPVVMGSIRSAVLISSKTVPACRSDNMRREVTASMSVSASSASITFSDSHWMSCRAPVNPNATRTRSMTTRGSKLSQHTSASSLIDRARASGCARRHTTIWSLLKIGR